MRGAQLYGLMALFVWLVNGCVTQAYVNAYSGPTLSKDQVALLKPTWGVEILSVNNNTNFSAKTKQIFGYRDVEMALPPGNHKIEIMLDTGDMTSDAVALDFFAQAGHKYLITYSREHYTFRPKIEDRTDRPDQWCMKANSLDYKGCKPD